MTSDKSPAEELIIYAAVPKALNSLMGLLLNKNVITEKEWQKIVDDATEAVYEYRQEHYGTEK